VVDVDHPLWWTIERFQHLVFEQTRFDPEDAWTCVLRVLAANPSEMVIANLAAGPLEDILNHHGAAFIDRIEAEAGRNPAFRDLMGGVWQRAGNAFWDRFDRARGGVRW
jgi:hypothetical protein